MTFVQAIDLPGRRVLLSSGAVLPIFRLYDDDLRETQIAEDARSFTILGGDLNLHIAAAFLPWPEMN